MHSRDLSLKYPHGHGFIAAASINRAGKLKLIAARAIVTCPSSSGWRSTSNTFRGNSGSSSRKSSPLCASETSPGRGIIPPPINPASRLYGAANEMGRCATNPCSESSTPRPPSDLRRLQRLFKTSGARIDGSRFASIVLPDPGGPIIKMLCPPAARHLQRPARHLLPANVLDVERKVLHLIQQISRLPLSERSP